MYAALPLQAKMLFPRLKLVTTRSQWSNLTVARGLPYVFLEILLVNSHPRGRLPLAKSNFADNLSQYTQAVDIHDSGDSISTLQPISKYETNTKAEVNRAKTEPKRSKLVKKHKLMLYKIYILLTLFLKKCLGNKVVTRKIKTTRQNTKIEYRKDCTLPDSSNAKMAINPHCGVKYFHLLDHIRPHRFKYRPLSLFHQQETAIKKQVISMPQCLPSLFFFPISNKKRN